MADIVDDASYRDASHRDFATIPAGVRIRSLGAIVMRCGLALIFLWFGAMKFTSYEATVIAPFIANSPLVGWLHASLGIQGASYLLGVVEVMTAVLLMAGFAKPICSVIGGAMGTLTFLITLSFFFTTPGIAEPLAGGFPAISAVPGQFLLKDLGLLGVSLFILGEALWRRRSGAASNGDPTYELLRNRDDPNAVVLRIGIAVIRFGLALIFLWFGAMKFTSYEATGIAPFIANSPIVGWWHALLGIQGSSYMLGVYEIATGILLALYRVVPSASVIGGAMAIFTFLITVTFFFSTPGITAPVGFPVISSAPGQFLLKDIGLLGISIWLLGEALGASAIVRPISQASSD